MLPDPVRQVDAEILLELDGQATIDDERVASLIKTTLREVGSNFSEKPREAEEIAAYSEAVADMLCAYLERLGTVETALTVTLPYAAPYVLTGIKLAVATNRRREFVDVELAAVEGGRWVDCFDAIVCGDEVARAKPDPMSYLLACERLGVAPADAIVIGDSGNDVAAARAAGEGLGEVRLSAGGA